MLAGSPVPITRFSFRFNPPLRIKQSVIRNEEIKVEEANSLREKKKKKNRISRQKQFQREI